jgi:hypothetical protein
MATSLIARKLVRAERQVVESERAIARQREVVSKGMARGQDVRAAMALLRSFEEIQKVHVALRDVLRQEAEGALQDRQGSDLG